MKLEYYGVAKENLKSGINLSVASTTRARHIKDVSTGKASEMLDWLKLPDMTEKEQIALEEIANKCRKMKDFVVLGIGGSALGIRFLKDTFVDSINADAKTKVTVCDNIDADKFIKISFTIDNTSLNEKVDSYVKIKAGDTLIWAKGDFYAISKTSVTDVSTDDNYLNITYSNGINNKFSNSSSPSSF